MDIQKIANEAAQFVVIDRSLEQEEGENPLVAFAYALGEGIEYEAGLIEFARVVIALAR
jgi:hypothetical protein